MIGFEFLKEIANHIEKKNIIIPEKMKPLNSNKEKKKPVETKK